MKNKIFLTSMLAVMVACPALAESQLVGTGASQYGEIYLGSGESWGNITEDCDANPLTYQGQSHQTGTFKLTAEWEKNKYKIHYQNGGKCSGQGSTVNNALEYDSDYSILGYSAAGISEPQGYTFGGWSTTSGATTWDTTTYSVGSHTYSSAVGNPWFNDVQTDTVNLYAVCTANSYDIVYTASEHCGTTTTATDALTYDANYTIANGSADSGYTFKGWSTTSGATTWDTTTYSVGSHTYSGAVGNPWFTDVNNGSVTLYSVCQANTYSVTYNCNGGNFASGVSSSPDSVTYGTTSYAFRALNSCEKSGYTNTGWTCYNTDSPTTTVNPWFVSQTWNLAMNVTCTATWNGVLNLEWYSRDGHNVADRLNTNSPSCDYGDTIDDINAPSAREGYTFKGWKVTDYVSGN